MIAAIRSAARSEGRDRSVEMWRGRLLQMARERFESRLSADSLEALAGRVARKEIDPYRAVDELLS